MPSQEDIAHQQELLAAYRRTLAQYLKQQALISELFAPPAIAHGIDEAREYSPGEKHATCLGYSSRGSAG